MIRGLKDFPISSDKEESLGFRDYVSALTDFIESAETPITIAIQGDWGTGKTSLMNLIYEKIKEKENIEGIWINTWQYSQFDLEKDLTISIVSAIIRKLNPPGESNSRKILKNLKLAKIAGSVISPIIEVLTASGELASKIEKTIELLFEKENDLAEEIEKLKSELTNIVQNKLEKENKSRIVIFIDDLDRLKPPRAVELLEVLKLFFDIEGTIFVLAIDYDVVLEGLKEKYGESIDEIKAKKFFEKIIQLPFNIPVSQYDIESYIKRLLDDIKVLTGSESAADINSYKEIIVNSIRFNPRTVKRLFNYLLLLKSITEKKGLLIHNSPIKPKEKLKVLFGITCMQLEYPELFSYIKENINYIDDEFFKELKSKLRESDSEFLRQVFKNRETDDDFIEDVKSFIDVFHKISKQENGKHLTENDKTSLKELFTLSNITTARTKENLKKELKKQNRKPKWIVIFNNKEEKLSDNKDLITKFIDFLYDFYDSNIEKIKKEIEKIPKKGNKPVVDLYSDIKNLSEYFAYRDFYILETLNDAYINENFIPYIQKFSKNEPLINDKNFKVIRGIP